MAPEVFDAARYLRAARRARTLSQRELATSARVPLSTISAIESGRRKPGLRLFVRILAGAGFELQVVDPSEHDAYGPRSLRLDEEHDAVRDRAGRRFPAHLRWAGKPRYSSGPYWWGWGHIAWYDYPSSAVPDHMYWHRPRTEPNRLGREPRQHPFWN